MFYVDSSDWTSRRIAWSFSWGTIKSISWLNWRDDWLNSCCCRLLEFPGFVQYGGILYKPVSVEAEIQWCSQCEVSGFSLAADVCEHSVCFNWSNHWTAAISPDSLKKSCNFVKKLSGNSGKRNFVKCLRQILNHWCLLINSAVSVCGSIAVPSCQHSGAVWKQFQLIYKQFMKEQKILLR